MPALTRFEKLGTGQSYTTVSGEIQRSLSHSSKKRNFSSGYVKMQLNDAFFQSAIFRNILYYLILCLKGIVGFKIEDDFVYLSTEGLSCLNINKTLRLLKNIKMHKMYKKLILELSQSIFNNKNTLFFCS